MRIWIEATFDDTADVAYLPLSVDTAAGEAIRQQCVELEGRGRFIVDFDSSGKVIGLEVHGVQTLFRSTFLAEKI